MALFPIYGRFAGDFVPHLCPVDTEDDMNAIAQQVAVHTLGRRLPEREGAALDVYVNGVRIPEETKLGELGLQPLAWVDVRFREDDDGGA
jgi:hypothetical protein